MSERLKPFRFSGRLEADDIDDAIRVLAEHFTNVREHLECGVEPEQVGVVEVTVEPEVDE